MRSSLKNEILNFFVVKDKKKMSKINNDFSFRKILLIIVIDLLYT